MITRHPSIFLLISLITLLGYQAKTQIDTEFWFVAPSVTEDHGDRPIMLRFTSFDEAANITISQPANPSWNPISFVINANATRTIDLTNRISMVENAPAFRVLTRGIHITSDQPITVYYEVSPELNPDIFSLKGQNALGQDFLIPAQNYWNNYQGYTPEAESSFDIVATQNDTEISMTPTVDIQGHSAGTTFTIVLQRGETYSIRAMGPRVQEQLTGTRVRSNHPIAITLKDDSNEYDPCHDLGGDQLVPIRVLGTEYIVVKGFLAGGDRVFIMATQDGTQLAIDGVASAVSLNTGDMHSFRLNDASTFIKASAPVYVLHATGFGCEIGLAILPKISCTGSHSVSFTRSTDENFGIILITEREHIAAFTFNNNNQNAVEAAQFGDVPGTDGRYVAAQINLTDQNQNNYRISNSSGSFHLGIINGGDYSGTRYAYFSDFKSLNLLADASRICLGAEVQLEVSGSEIYEWFGHPEVEGMTSSILSISPNEDATLGVIGYDGQEGCRDTAYIDVEVFKWPRPDISISQSCIGAATTFRYNGVEELELLQWIFGQDTFVTRGQDSLALIWQEPGDKELIIRAINPAGCLVDTTIIFDVGGINLDYDTIVSIDAGSTAKLQALLLSGDLEEAIFRWEPPIGLSCTDCLEPDVSPSTETTYRLQVEDAKGCTSIFNTHVFVDAAAYIPNAFSPNGDGINDHFEIYTPEDLQLEELRIYNRWGQMYYQWNREDTNVRPGWSGEVLGSSLQAAAGVYVFFISGRYLRSNNHFERSGSIHLVR